VQRLTLKVAYVSGELNTVRRCVPSGFRLEVAENCALLGCCSASCGNFFYRRFGFL